MGPKPRELAINSTRTESLSQDQTRRAPELAEVMADVAKAMHGPRSVTEVLDMIVHTAADTIPGVNHAGVSVPGMGTRPRTRAATDDLAVQADLIQYELDEGPCMDALHAEATFVQVDGLSDDQRWPWYAPRAAALGVRSQMAFQLHTDTATLGALNLYSSQTDVLERDARQAAALFATHAALALAGAQERDHSAHALSSRKTIGQAIGIIQERYDLDEHRAFEFLVRVSRTGNIKLRDVAANLIREPGRRGDRTE